MDTFQLILRLFLLMLFADWLNYCLGSPLADRDYDLRAILAWIPERLARRRLRRMAFEEYQKAAQQLQNDLQMTKCDPVGAFEARQEYRRHAYEQGRRFFTWEKTFLCRVCLHWWLTALFLGALLILGIRFDVVVALLTYLLTHLLIKKF